MSKNNQQTKRSPALGEYLSDNPFDYKWEFALTSKQTTTPQPDSSKGVLQDKWKRTETPIPCKIGKHQDGYFIGIYNGNGANVAEIRSLLEHLTEREKEADLIVKAVNERQSLLDEIEDLKMTKNLHEIQLNETLKQNQRLKDSNRKLLKALKELSQLVTMSDLAFSPQNVNAKSAINNAKDINP